MTDGTADRSRVVRLVVHVEQEATSTPTSEGFSARLVVETDTGTQVDLLTDRGWGVDGAAESLAATTAEDIAREARMVTGPDEPWGEETAAEAAAAHWANLSATLAGQGLDVPPEQLAALPCAVAFGPVLQRRFARPS